MRRTERAEEQAEAGTGPEGSEGPEDRRAAVNVDSVYTYNATPRDCSARLKSREALLNGELADFESADTFPSVPEHLHTRRPTVNGARDVPDAG